MLLWRSWNLSVDMELFRLELDVLDATDYLQSLQNKLLILVFGSTDVFGTVFGFPGFS